ncbi:MAG TPA: hypothetical protein VEC96_09560, partial [Anaerolineae bacterium]|nr:hypothetical protein [Anaerolineae bacterium]
ELSPVEDLLIYGSRTFDQMIDLLAGRGEATQLALPTQVAPGTDDQPTFPLPLHNCRLVENEVQTGDTPFYVFNFRAVYLSDEKQEEFMTLALDAQGQPHPIIAAALARLETFLAPDQPVSIEREKLRRILDQATGLARQQADARAAELERALQPRLQKVLLRLTTFYGRLADEVDTGDPARDETVRADLQRDLARKTADELESHRLRVTLWPLNYAIVLTPLAHYRLTLATRHTQQTLAIVQNLHTGGFEDFICRHCRQPLDHLALCDREHAVHLTCLATCHHCQRDICRACGIQACALCDNSVCRDCVAACAHCDRWLCAAHITACAICGQAYCAGHSFGCRWCEQLYCLKCGVSGECRTCHAALDTPASAVETLPAIPGLKPNRYHWRRGTNQAFAIYIGQGKGFFLPLLGRVVIVTNKAGEVTHWRKFGVWKLLSS